MKKLLLSFFAFSIVVRIFAQTTVSSLVNTNIPDNNTSGVSDIINISSTETILDIKINVTVQHSYVGDIGIILTSPSGTDVILVDRIGVPASTYGCSLNDIIAEFDDNASSAIESACPPNGSYVPQEPLFDLNGEPLNGIWTLRVVDLENTATGVFIDWSITYETATNVTNNIFYVNKDATGANNGTSWTDAFTDPSEVVLSPNVSDGDTVWVAAGTYYPVFDENADPTPSDLRTKEFALIDLDLNIYGGFNGTETQLSQRNWANNPTILSGDIGVVGDETDNCYTVFKAINSSFILDGFTISNGYANGLSGSSISQKNGAGILIVNALSQSVLINNCIIKDNKARSEAGIMCVTDGAATDTTNITIQNTRFTNNLARWGAAFSMFTYSGTLNPTFINCLIDNNTTDNFNSEAGNTFSGGRFFRYTGGVINGKVINCTFTKNSENNSVIPGANRAVFGVQGVDNNTEIYNTIFYDNNVNNTGTSIGFSTNTAYIPASVTVYNTISEDVMDLANYVTSTNNTQVNPYFTNTNFNDFTLQNGSSAINSGTTSGITSLIPATDLAGDTRENGIIDIGCYEYQGVVGVREQISKKTLSVYPNPTSRLLTIETRSSNIENISIIDLTGKVVKSITPATNTINVSNIVNGVYFLQIQTQEGVFNSKFIKE
jgi:subtilisin-like proprotein convertase family protein